MAPISTGQGLAMGDAVAVGGNAPTLNALTLSTTTFPAGVAAGTLLATISGNTSGSTIAISSADTSGYFAVSGTGLFAGLNYPSVAGGATPTVQLTETLAGSSNSPKTTPIAATITSSSSSKITPFSQAFIAPMLGAY